MERWAHQKRPRAKNKSPLTSRTPRPILRATWPAWTIRASSPGGSAAQTGRHALGCPRQSSHRQPARRAALGALGGLLADPPRPVPATDGGCRPAHLACGRRGRAASRRQHSAPGPGIRAIIARRRACRCRALLTTSHTHARPASAPPAPLRLGNFAVAHPPLSIRLTQARSSSMISFMRTRTPIWYCAENEAMRLHVAQRLGSDLVTA